MVVSSAEPSQMDSTLLDIAQMYYWKQVLLSTCDIGKGDVLEFDELNYFTTNHLSNPSNAD